MRVVLTQPKFRGSAEENFAHVSALLADGDVSGADLIVLPELIGLGMSTALYETSVAALARRFNAHIVGGSHFAQREGGAINQGFVVGPDGGVLTSYEKANPYFDERNHGAGRGTGAARVTIAGQTCLIVICADFFHAQTYVGLAERVDLIVVTASSVSRKPTPDLARARWKHAMIARAFEQTAHVAVSDWAYPVGGQSGLPASGVAGVAYPDADMPEQLISTLGESELLVYDLDLAQGRVLFDDQRVRGFSIAGVREQ